MKGISVSTLLLVSQLLAIPGAYAESSPLLGQVIMDGSIVDSACAIDTGSYEQAVDMGTLPVSTLQQQIYGPVQHFSIALIGCTLTAYDGATWQTFSMTFEGPASGDYFTVSGGARGVALLLQDSDGKTIYPGKSELKKNIETGKSVLYYGLRLVADNHLLYPGQYQTAIRFKLDYY